MSKQFNNEDYSSRPFPVGDYEQCTFTVCNFANADVASINFQDCTFTNCDWSMAQLKDTTFQTVVFNNCKLLGLHFEDCNPFLFAADFRSCQLNLASFYKMNLKDCTFDTCSLQEVDFVGTNLSGLLFNQCNFAGANFEQTNLEGADFRKASHFRINPELNRIQKAKFSIEDLPGLLEKYDLEIDEF